MRSRFATAALAILLLAPAVLAAETGPIVGTWELARADGVHPRDIPPWGFANLLVEFTRDGRVRHWTPQRRSEAREVGYEFVEGKLVGWIGLSNDMTTPRAIAFPADGWLEITLPDGFVATFRRVADAEGVSLSCAYFTVEGHDFDPGYVSEIKRVLFSFTPEPVPELLRGHWVTTVGDEAEGRQKLSLSITGDLAKLTVESIDFPSIPADIREGAIEVFGTYLRSKAIACNAINRFQISTDSLSLTVDGQRSLDFRRAD